MSNTYTVEQVAEHNTPEDFWVIIEGGVYDLSKFRKFHPGGKQVLDEFAGKDATEAFFGLHRLEVLAKYQRFRVGSVAGYAGPDSLVSQGPGSMSQVPYAEPSYWNGWKSPYFNESHAAARKDLRKFFDEEIYPDAVKLEAAGKPAPLSMWQAMGKAGLLAARIGPGPHLKIAQEMGIRLPGGVSPEEFDYFHEMVAHEEVFRMGCNGIQDGLGAGLVIGLPPVLHFGQPAVAERVAREVLSGNKRICLAISSAFYGSDVKGIKCTATKTPDGRHYIVNGHKKWITNGTFCDYFVTAVRTGPPGLAGLSLLLIERSEGLETELIKTSYSPSAGTAFVTYENVKVPVENLLGKENQGFSCIMKNFNHERWMIVVGVSRSSRRVVEECFKWASLRKVFGKPLISQPVIRLKLASMVAQLEAVQSWLDFITYQMTQMSYEEQSKKLAGPISLLKYLSTRAALSISDDACQIFGGRAITKSGMGQIVERNQRAVKFAAIYGGSEEIMADLGIRQALKYFPRSARL